MTLNPIITSLSDIDAYKPNMGAVIAKHYGMYIAKWALKVRNADVDSRNGWFVSGMH